jgi:glycerophosphoryl diester phosphodiesterase
MNIIDFFRQSSHILIGGHRGCGVDGYVENTIPAFEEGLRRGASYIELDLQMTKDDVIVVFHDMQLSNKTELTGYISDFTYEELRAVWPLETLENVLEWAKRKNTYLLLELKFVVMDMGEKIHRFPALFSDIVIRHGATDIILPFSAEHRVIRAIKNLAPAIRTGLIMGITPCDVVTLMKGSGAELCVSYVQQMDSDIIASLHAAGMVVSAGIQSDPYVIRRAGSLGCDLIESDFPDETAKILRNAGYNA